MKKLRPVILLVAAAALAGCGGAADSVRELPGIAGVKMLTGTSIEVRALPSEVNRDGAKMSLRNSSQEEVDVLVAGVGDRFSVVDRHSSQQYEAVRLEKGKIFFRVTEVVDLRSFGGQRSESVSKMTLLVED